MGLSEAGLTLPTGSELLDQMVDEYELLTGLTVDRNRTDDQAVMIMATMMATQLAEALELVQSVYDGTNPDAATGKQAEDAAYLVGVEPDPASKSQATVTLTALAGTVIPEGSIVEGGGADGTARWLTSEDVTSTGSDDVVVVAQVAGPVLAEAGDIDTIVSTVSGWSAVTNAEAANPGKNRETFAALRSKRRLALQKTGSTSTSAIRAALLDLDYVDGCVVLENNSSSTQVISNKSLKANSIYIFVHPPALTPAQEDEIAKKVHAKVSAGTELGGSDVERDVTDIGGVTTHYVVWDESTAKEADFTITVTLEAGYELSDVTQALQDAMEDFFDDMLLGQVLRVYDLTLATSGIAGIDGVAFGTLLIDAGAESFDFDPGIDGFLTLGTVTVE